MIDTKKQSGNTFPSQAITAKECSDTGMAMVLICLLGGWFTGVRDWFLAAIVLLVLNMIWPTLYYFVAKVWLGLSHLLGAVMSRVILTLVFFLVVTPLALLRRALGHDPMQVRAWKAGTGSVFETRDHAFTSEEIERPF